ncbi:hypothetical protein EV401DRAFT_2080818 [Pisolithus croceorrhizus]|nr:hypothetical protein EV401DRAFT_2080818 [Pisolithus croceorrhizus]
MKYPPRLWFYSEVLLDDIIPLIATRLSTYLLTPIVPARVTVWKLKKPRQLDEGVFAIPPLESIATRLFSRQPIAPYISRGNEQVSLFVHLVPNSPQGKKRVPEEVNDDLVEIVKHTKIAIQSPSSLAEPHTFRTLHKVPGEPILDHRSVHDAENRSSRERSFMDDLPPISLQYEGFGHFLDIFRGCKNVPGVENVSFARLRSAVDKFAESMSLIYRDEDERREKGSDALDNIFSQRTDDVTFASTAAGVSKGTNSGGRFLGPHRAAYCITEFKNESGCGSAIPYVEMTGNFAHSMREAADHSDSISVMHGWNLPCLGITITGHYVTFYAMIFFGKWRVVSLTPALSCIQASGDGDDRIALYNAFTAASVLLARIQGDATKLVHKPPLPIGESRRILPPISRLCHPHSGTHISFNILKHFHNRAADRYLYTAETVDNKQIVIKFTRQYSFELHMFCADRGHAPALLGFERLPGGFFGIAMEFVRSAFPISQSPYVERHLEWAEQLLELVQSFHAEGLVHGDLRASNIICDGNRVMLIDFDWSGKEGEASYPHGPFNTDPLIGRDSPDLKITKGDDFRLLERTLKGMRFK